MRIRVLVTRGRPAVSVSVEEGSTLGRVREAVTAVQNVCDHFELSLNGRDCLDSSCTLEELGIVSGDLLYVVHQEQLTNDNQDISHMTGHVTNGAAEVMATREDTTSCVTNMETVAMGDRLVKSSVGPESGMECRLRHEHQYASTNVECERECTLEGASLEIGQTANHMESEQATVCTASSVRELEQDGMESRHDCASSAPESSTPVPESRFDCLLDGSYPIGAEQCGVPVLCLALHMLMLDAGFLSRQKSSPDGAGVASSSGVYRWDYGTAISAEVGVSLVCAEMGPTLVVHACTTGLEGHEGISSSLQLNISTYVNTDPPNTAAVSPAPHRLLRSGKQLSRIFKDAIAHRMSTEIRKAVGLPEVGTFMSLFQEVKLLVMRQLPSASLVSLSCVCRELWVLSQDDFLWRDLLFRDFGRRASTKKDEKMSWKEFYIQLYRLRLEERKSRQQRLLSLDMEPGRLAPQVVYPPGFRIPGVIGGDYDRLPNLFAPPTYLPPFVGPHLSPRPRRDPRNTVWSSSIFSGHHSSNGAPDSNWRVPRLPARQFSHLGF